MRKSIPRQVVQSMLAIAVGAVVGCAPAYHDYPCGCVPYRYCAPPPLPYTPYAGCPTPIADCYLSHVETPTPHVETPTPTVAPDQE